MKKPRRKQRGIKKASGLISLRAKPRKMDRPGGFEYFPLGLHSAKVPPGRAPE